MLLKCRNGDNLNITQHDDIGNGEVNGDTRAKISHKDASHCVSGTTDHKGISQGFDLYHF